MNATTKIAKQNAPAQTPKDRVMPRGMRGLREFSAEVDTLKDTLSNLVAVADPDSKPGIQELLTKAETLEPSVTFIGQVKAGKTSLVNSMVGRPGLLPADVNPWTTVVTSLHLNTPGLEEGTSASFRFFGEDEWDRLVHKGGRLGELSKRAGAEDENEKVRRQVEEMREKSRKRLGKRFELLLGQEHTYGYFDEDLIERYVCLGDDIELIDAPVDDLWARDTLALFVVSDDGDLAAGRVRFNGWGDKQVHDGDETLAALLAEIDTLLADGETEFLLKS